jgi:hypothetical protein
VDSPTGTFGNVGRGTFDGPGIIMLDMGLMKNFKVSEKIGLQFRAETYNSMNHPNFADPVSSIANPLQTGRITSTSTDPREFQFGFRMSF